MSSSSSAAAAAAAQAEDGDVVMRHTEEQAKPTTGQQFRDDEAPENANEGCVGPDADEAGQAPSCQGCPNQSACATGQLRQRDPVAEQVAQALENVKHKILVLSGKGGVGKSMVASQLTWLLGQKKSCEVGLLDIDICGPSQPRMMGVEHENVHRSNTGWTPVYAADNVGVMSVGFLLNKREDAIIWRGPRKDGLIKQFLTEVVWSDLDVLVIDTPPGTSDEHISIVQYLKQTPVDGAIIVTTPQEVALLDVRKEITFCRKVALPIIGVLENMSGFVCPCCSTRSEIFPPISGGAEQMAKEMEVPFLGSIPLDPQLLQCCEAGQSYFEQHPDGPATGAFQQVLASVYRNNPALKQTLEG